MSVTQRHLDMSGVPMPNFMNIGNSLRRELNEDFDDGENNMMGNLPHLLQTPDLIIEEEESDSELSIMEELTEQEGTNQYTTQI